MRIHKPILLRIGIMLFFLSGTIYVTDQFKAYHYAALLGGIFLIWAYAGSPLPRYIYRSSIFNPYSLFVITVALSFLANREISMIITMAGLILLWWTSNTLLPKACALHQVGAKDIYKLLLVFQLVIFAYSLVSGNFRVARYKGIFTNPNACGGAAATLCAVACAYLLDNVVSGEAGHFRKAIFSGGLIVFSVFMALISTSRTSVITIALMLMLMLLLLVRKGVSKMQSGGGGTVVAVLLVFFVTLIFLYKFTSLQSLVDTIIRKFMAKEADPLDGRTAKWNVIFERLKLLGNGESMSNAAHNTYFSILDQYGILAFVAWTSFVAKGIIWSIRRAFAKCECPMKNLPLFSFFCFAVTSLTEGMMLKTIMLLSVFSVGVSDGKYDKKRIRD